MAIGLALQILDDPINPMNYLERKVVELKAEEGTSEAEDDLLINTNEVPATETTPIKTSKAPPKQTLSWQNLHCPQSARRQPAHWQGLVDTMGWTSGASDGTS